MILTQEPRDCFLLSMSTCLLLCIGCGHPKPSPVFEGLNIQGILFASQKAPEISFNGFSSTVMPEYGLKDWTFTLNTGKLPMRDAFVVLFTGCTGEIARLGGSISTNYTTKDFSEVNYETGTTKGSCRFYSGEVENSTSAKLIAVVFECPKAP
jgi:hypothetical protein